MKSKSNYLEENVNFASLISSWVISLDPQYGNYITINGLKIYKNIHPEQYNTLVNIYFTVLNEIKTSEFFPKTFK